MIDIGTNSDSSELSNFTHYIFWFDGILCNSMEGLLQAFKFEDQKKAFKVCQLIGVKAKYRGKKRNKAWKSQQCLWWKGIRYERDSDEYQTLLDMAYNALNENSEFRNNLMKTKGHKLTHKKYGSMDETKTILTRSEFCDRLMLLRGKEDANTSMEM